MTPVIFIDGKPSQAIVAVALCHLTQPSLFRAFFSGKRDAFGSSDVLQGQVFTAHQQIPSYLINFIP